MRRAGIRPMRTILTLNGGSSSIRFAVFTAQHPLQRLLHGKMERVGGGMELIVESVTAGTATRTKVAGNERSTAAGFLLDWLESQPVFESIAGGGHRVVHGMLHTQPEPVTAALMDELRRIVPFDPEHLPGEIELIEAVSQRRRELPQVVCFDTAFHRSMPPVATQIAIPRRYAAKGVRRYGFHGLSYTFLMQELARLGDPAAERGRVILA